MISSGVLTRQRTEDRGELGLASYGNLRFLKGRLGSSEGDESVPL